MAMISFTGLQQALDDYRDCVDTCAENDAKRKYAAASVALRIMAILQGEVNTEPDVKQALNNFAEVDWDSFRHEEWFVTHPGFEMPMVCELADGEMLDAMFIGLKGSATKARISACGTLADHWEDGLGLASNIYEFAPVGLYFFAPSNSASIIIAVSRSQSHSLRTMELRGRLSNTQKRILNGLYGLLSDTGSGSHGDSELDKEKIHTALWEAFNVSGVNKRFYAGIVTRFNELVQALVSSGHDEGGAKMFASRLIGRILFVWFLDQKGFLNPRERYLEIGSLESSEYYERKLKRLFFGTLNTPKDKRTKDGDIVTPFLNGGLFEEQATDFPGEGLSFPDGFFNGLYDHFNQFDFTTDESTSDYEQVAIDPEMLGRIFESLLAEQMDDTGKTARKEKGAFYTPREIVSYMCRESLRQYLYRALGHEDVVRGGVDRLLDTPENEWETASDAKGSLWNANTGMVLPRAVKALNDVRVLDPACGSGAFPMGMLQLLMRCRTRLLGKRAVSDTYQQKLNILQNNIFGVDIEPMAVEIARLRVWLSMIVERENIAQVEPLPNLDFKFVCADSLIPLAKDVVDGAEQSHGRTIGDVDLAGGYLGQGAFDLTDEKDGLNRLKEIRAQYFTTTDPEAKGRLMEEFERTTQRIGGDDMSTDRAVQIASFHPHASISSESGHAPFFDPELMFGVDAFDVVIGNPPYVQLQKMSNKAVYAALGYRSYNKTGDLYELFYERGAQLLSEHGVLDYITSNKWMRNRYGKELREYLAGKTEVISLIDLGAGRFSSATVDTNIMLFGCGRTETVPSAVRYEDTSLDGIAEYVKANATTIPFSFSDRGSETRGSGPWVILTDVERSIKGKMEEAGTPLGEMDVRINYGVKTGLNDAFIITKEKRDELIASDPKSAEIIRPVLRGRDIKRYSYEFADLYVLTLFPSLEKNIDDYTAVKDWLINGDWVSMGRTHSPIGSGKLRLEQTGARHTFEGVTFKARKATSNRWFETQDAISYYGDFAQPKIVWGEISDRAKFTLDGTGKYAPEATAFLMTGQKLKMILGFLNSSLSEYYFSTLGTTTGMGTVRWKKYTIEQLPITRMSGNDIRDFDELVDSRIHAEHPVAASIDKEINEYIGELLGLTVDELRFIECFRSSR
ncbi:MULTISPECIES: Eco57I restriction-modification methylase domain-containing protein [Bifidobacterium]|nr:MULTISPECIES: TaqI-like C-terminal specificity domain-containing protein [Bifidobacterium]